MPNSLFLILILVSIILFFWGIVKAIKTQKNKYAWAMLPFFIMMGVMFIR
ncbi:MAG: hypothetical protein FAF03_07635 [Epsilonproteobacteria bacterium]|nr:hypothetical protein [Campylobacterota bacterium]